MKLEHKAIMARAAKEGLLPSEMASELVLHDMVQACKTQMELHEVGMRKMSEKQQDAVLATLQDNLKSTAITIAKIIAGAGTAAIEMTLKDLKVSNGQLTGTVKSTEAHYNDLISKVQDKSDVLIVLYERDYFDALDNIQSDKDQKSLPLDDDKPAKKPAAKAKGKSAADTAASIALDPAMMEKAIKFIEDVKTPTIAGIQNVLSIGFQKAEAVLAELARLGHIVAEEDGSYSMPKAETAPKGKAKEKVADAPLISSLDEATYEAIKAGVIEKQSVAIIAITIKHGVTDEVAEEAIDRLEMEQVVSAEDDMGGREVLIANGA